MAAWNNFLDAVVGWFKLVPPLEATPEQRRRWDLTVALGGLAMAFGSLLHIAAACGWLEFMSVPGFATVTTQDTIAADVKDIKHGLTRRELIEIREAITDNRRRWCIALASDQPTGAYEDIVNANITRYIEATTTVGSNGRVEQGQAPVLQPCSDFVRQ